MRVPPLAASSASLWVPNGVVKYRPSATTDVAKLSLITTRWISDAHVDNNAHVDNTIQVGNAGPAHQEGCSPLVYTLSITADTGRGSGDRCRATHASPVYTCAHQRCHQRLKHAAPHVHLARLSEPRTLLAPSQGRTVLWCGGSRLEFVMVHSIRGSVVDAKPWSLLHSALVAVADCKHDTLHNGIHII